MARKKSADHEPTPIEDIRTLIRFLRGQDLPSDFGGWVAFAQSATVVLQYMLSHLSEASQGTAEGAEQPASAAMEPPGPCTQAELLTHLEQMEHQATDVKDAAKKGAGVEAPSQGAFPWEALIPVVLDLIKQFMDRRKPKEV